MKRGAMLLVAVTLMACTGGPGDLPNGSSSGSSSSSSSTSSTSSSGSPVGGNTTIHASEFDQSCSTASDCIAVKEGDVCACSCPSAAINESDVGKYQSKVVQLKSSCSGTQGCGVSCAQNHVECNASQCEVVQGAADGG